MLTFTLTTLLLSKMHIYTKWCKKGDKKKEKKRKCACSLFLSAFLRLYLTGKASLLSSGYVQSHVNIMKSVYGNHRHVLFQEVTLSTNTVLTQMFLRGSLLQTLVILDVRVCILPSVSSSDTTTLQTKTSSQQSLHVTRQTWLGISNAFSIAMLSKTLTTLSKEV